MREDCRFRGDGAKSESVDTFGGTVGQAQLLVLHDEDLFDGTSWHCTVRDPPPHEHACFAAAGLPGLGLSARVSDPHAARS